MQDQALTITPEVLRELSALRTLPKFHQELEHFYPGAATEEIRLAAEKAVNAMLERMRVRLLASLRKSYVMAEFLKMLKAFENADTEEREQACEYCERIMKILGIEGSDGMLNTWLYGFDPGRKP